MTDFKEYANSIFVGDFLVNGVHFNRIKCDAEGNLFVEGYDGEPRKPDEIEPTTQTLDIYDNDMNLIISVDSDVIF